MKPLSPETNPRRLKALALALAFVCCLTATDAASLRERHTQEAATQRQKGASDARVGAERAQSNVRGRVVYDDTNRPVRRAQVQIYDPSKQGRGANRMGWTNSRGEFLLRNVAAGTYYITVEAPGIVRPQYDSPDAYKDRTTVSVDGTSDAEVKVRVERGGSITGKVTYADGEPAVEANIIINRKRDGQLTVVYLGSRHNDRMVTDDRGVYRVAGLPPGEYVVGAAERKYGEGEMEEDGSVRLFQTALSTTFYPAALSPRQASTIRVEAGAEVEGIDITLIERNTHSVSGMVIERGTQRPVARAEVALRAKDEQGTASPYQSPGTQTDAQGRWWFEEVQEGSYVVMVTPSYERSERRGSDGGNADVSTGSTLRNFVVKRQDLNVSGDIAGLSIEVSAGARVSGTVVVEGSRPLPPGVVIYAEPTVREGDGQATSAARARPDGTFTIEGVPSGSFHFNVYVPPDNKFYTKAVSGAGGIDLLRDPLDVGEGEEVKGLRILLSPDVATFTGRVLSAQGALPLRGAFVLLIPTDAARRRMRRTMRLQALTGADGSFSLNAAPGEYAAVVFRPGELTYRSSEAQIEARAAKSRLVTLRPGERTTLDLNAPGDN